MTLFPGNGNLPPEKSHFNYRLIFVANTFGRLQGGLLCFLKQNEVGIVNVKYVVK